MQLNPPWLPPKYSGLNYHEPLIAFWQHVDGTTTHLLLHWGRDMFDLNEWGWCDPQGQKQQGKMLAWYPLAKAPNVNLKSSSTSTPGAHAKSPPLKVKEHAILLRDVEA